MVAKRWILFIVAFVLLSFAKAQNKKADSLQLVHTLKLISEACKNEKPDPNGRYYKASQYIVYRGDDKKRAWKDFVNYADKDEKYETDHICKRIERTINAEVNYKIVKYFTKKESEGIWNVLIVSCKVDGVQKQLAFAFLKIGSKFGLGDIDQNYKE